MDTAESSLMEKILQVPKFVRNTVGFPIIAVGIWLTILAIKDIWDVLFGSEYYGTFWDFCGIYLIIKFIGPLIVFLGYYIIDPEDATDIMNDTEFESGSETKSSDSEPTIIDVELEIEESGPID